MTSLYALVVTAEGGGVPEAKDVVAGWTALWIFVAMAVATALLCWSMVRQMRKVNRSKELGVYDDDPRTPSAVENQP